MPVQMAPNNIKLSKHATDIQARLKVGASRGSHDKGDASKKFDATSYSKTNFHVKRGGIFQGGIFRIDSFLTMQC